MKKLVVQSAVCLSLLVGGISLNSCDRIEDAVEDVSIPVPFNISPDIEYQTIPFASIPTEEYYSIPITLNIDLDQKIKEQSSALSIDNLKSAKLESMNIQLIDHTLNAELDVISSAKLYLKTPDLDRVLVGTADQNQITADRIDFETVDNELAEYFKSAENSLIVDMQGAEISIGEMTLDINPSFRIEVGP